uniref:FAD synthase n=1 Tax=Ciona intestinalis TaxID=7719 RepID=F6YUA5_CIOIN|nr:FAD synthase [Ciona intestinalis]|eukprot:XP_009862013.1 FAD synthase [Ciona intestinalis]
MRIITTGLCEKFTKTKHLCLNRLHTCVNHYNMSRTAGILIIGDEILKGQTQDTNSVYLSQSLHKLGVNVRKISVIGDNVDEIAVEVRKFSSDYDMVLTSGGIGPTHDDVTLEGVARACDVTIHPHPTLVELCEKYFGVKDLNSPQLKLAHVPETSQLHFGVDPVKKEKLKFPLIAVNNIYVFPGIPVLLQRLFTSLQHLFKTEDKFSTKEILVNCLETEIAEVLQNCVDEFKHAGLNIGSYPDWSNNYYKVRIVLESLNHEVVDAATQYLHMRLPSDRILLNYVLDPVSLNGGDINATNFQSMLWHKVKSSLEVLEETLRKYEPHEICVGFNGGKDCTALLHLYHAALCRAGIEINPTNFKALYIKDKYPFEEVEQFMESSVIRYKFHLTTMTGDMKQALEALKRDHPSIKAVVMGTRCSDPHSMDLSSFTMTDSDWPRFMRVNPLLHWTYHDVWKFMRKLYLPYCVLYDKGYTSLGSRDKTERNKKLLTTNIHGSSMYLPAYTLQDGDLERNGRL